MAQEREYNGPKFSAAQRKVLRARAWEMHRNGMIQKAIATELGVSQPTIFGWLQKEKQERAKGNVVR